MFSVCCHPEIMLPWQNDAMTSPLCSHYSVQPSFQLNSRYRDDSVCGYTCRLKCWQFKCVTYTLIQCLSVAELHNTVIYFLLLVQSNLVNTDTEGAIHVESVRINRMSVLLSRLNLEKM